MIGGTRIAAESCCSCDAGVQVGSSEEDPRDGLVLWCSEEECVFPVCLFSVLRLFSFVFGLFICCSSFAY